MPDMLPEVVTTEEEGSDSSKPKMPIPTSEGWWGGDSQIIGCPSGTGMGV
ncbi:MAG: hypothetical protein Q7K33_01785 [Candidatus Berkelbacteria bacterium]|nr:hypothetical protein [Candidatus Berkelbacteria bacterium]